MIENQDCALNPLLEEVLSEMDKVPQFTTPVITLRPDNTLHDAIFSMIKNDIKRIVIVRNDLPVGIVTERDVGRFLEYDKSSRTLDEIKLDEIMSRNLITVSREEADIPTQCAIRMDTFQISSVIVTEDDGKAVGIITKSDLAQNFDKLYSGTYKVKDYMSRRLITCRKTDSLVFTLDILNKNKISRLVVTDNEGKPVGIISYDSFLRNSGYFKGEKKTRDYLLPSTSAKEMKVSQIIDSEILTIQSEVDLANAAKLMTRYKVSGIPVVDLNGNLEGVISATDIVRAYTKVKTHSRLIKRDPHFA